MKTKLYESIRVPILVYDCEWILREIFKKEVQPCEMKVEIDCEKHN